MVVTYLHKGRDQSWFQQEERREGGKGGKGGRLESPPLPFIPGHLPKDIVIVLKQVRDILPSFGYGVQMVKLKYIESEREREAHSLITIHLSMHTLIHSPSAWLVLNI